MDIILVSYAKNNKLKKITENAIRSIGAMHNIIIIESNTAINYRNTTTIHPGKPFNYNKYLNIGAKSGNQELIFFGNNDLMFEKNWAKEIQQKMREHDLVSASPLCPETHGKFGIDKSSNIIFGYKVYEIFCGWAFVLKRSFYDKLGGLNESLNFWCSDNVVIHQLKKFNVKHALVPSSIVHHLNQGGNTLKTLNLARMKSYTVEEIKKYNILYQEDLRIDFSWEMPDILRKFLFQTKK